MNEAIFIRLHQCFLRPHPQRLPPFRLDSLPKNMAFLNGPCILKKSMPLSNQFCFACKKIQNEIVCSNADSNQKLLLKEKLFIAICVTRIFSLSFLLPKPMSHLSIPV